jgi:hypothetical protein
MKKKADKQINWKEEMKIYYKKHGYEMTRQKFSPLTYEAYKFLGQLLHGEIA